MPSSVLNKVSPLQKLFHCQPDYHFMKAYGCSCYSWLKSYTSHKLSFRSLKCVFIGYGLQHKGYRCLDPTIGRVYISRHVVFDETTFPFHHHSPTPTSTIIPTSPMVFLPPPPQTHPINSPLPPLNSPPLTPISHHIPNCTPSSSNTTHSSPSTSSSSSSLNHHLVTDLPISPIQPLPLPHTSHPLNTHPLHLFHHYLPHCNKH